MYIPHSKPDISQKAISAVNECLRYGNISKGKVAEAFQSDLVSYLDTPGLLVLTSSGSAALYLALKSINICPGDEVILPTYVCSSVAETILRAGGKPVFCDISDNWLMMPENVKKHINAHTKAIIIVHIFGIYAPVAAYRQFSVPLIEDCCQLFAHTVNNQRVGVDADFSFYSFHATKCLTTGEGGAIACVNNEYQDAFLKVCAEYAALFPLSDMAATLGLSQLEEYEYMQKRRVEIAGYYFDALPAANTSMLKNIDTNLYFRFPLRVQTTGFEKIKQQAHAKNVAIRKGVDELLHIKYAINADCPNADVIFTQTVSIPLYPALTDEEVGNICTVVNEILHED